MSLKKRIEDLAGKRQHNKNSLTKAELLALYEGFKKTPLTEAEKKTFEEKYKKSSLRSTGAPLSDVEMWVFQGLRRKPPTG